MTAIAISRCARSQRDDSLQCRNSPAAWQRDLRTFRQGAAMLLWAMPGSRDSPDFGIGACRWRRKTMQSQRGVRGTAVCFPFPAIQPHRFRQNPNRPLAALRIDKQVAGRNWPRRSFIQWLLSQNDSCSEFHLGREAVICCNVAGSVEATEADLRQRALLLVLLWDGSSGQQPFAAVAQFDSV